jgi:hypothetical protein
MIMNVSLASFTQVADTPWNPCLPAVAGLSDQTEAQHWQVGRQVRRREARIITGDPGMRLVT